MQFVISQSSPLIALMAGVNSAVEGNYRKKAKAKKDIVFTEGDIIGDPTMMTAVPDYSKFPPIDKNIVSSWMENGFYVIVKRDAQDRNWFLFINHEHVRTS